MRVTAIEMRLLRDFVAVAEQKSFRGAALKMHVSQPPLTRHIQQLEAALGTTLFIRNARGVELTDAGAIYYEDAKHILALNGEAAERAVLAGQGQVGRIDIGVYGSAMFDIIPKIIREFRSRHPRVEVAMHNMGRDSQTKALRDRRISVAFNRLFADEADLRQEVVLTERLHFALPSQHPLASRAELGLKNFRRVRQFPSNQRFEPLVPGAVWFLSDPWAAGDPFLTWGNHKIEERKPMLGPWAADFSRHDENWEPPRQKDNPKFFDIPYEMAPEVIVTSCEPTGYPRSPVSKRVAYVDVRNCMAASNIRYDRQGKLWSNFEMAHGVFKGGGKDGKRFIKSHDGVNAGWSWIYVHIYDFQNRRMSLCNHSKGAAGVEAKFNADPEWLFNTYCTAQGIQALGRA